MNTNWWKTSQQLQYNLKRSAIASLFILSFTYINNRCKFILSYWDIAPARSYWWTAPSAKKWSEKCSDCSQNWPASISLPFSSTNVGWIHQLSFIAFQFNPPFCSLFCKEFWSWLEVFIQIDLFSFFLSFLRSVRCISPPRWNPSNTRVGLNWYPVTRSSSLEPSSHLKIWNSEELEKKIS